MEIFKMAQKLVWDLKDCRIFIDKTMKYVEQFFL